MYESRVLLHQFLNDCAGMLFVRVFDGIVDCVSAVLVSMVGLQSGETEESANEWGCSFFACEHKETHFHSVKDCFTLVLTVIDICSVPIFFQIMATSQAIRDISQMVPNPAPSLLRPTVTATQVLVNFSVAFPRTLRKILHFSTIVSLLSNCSSKINKRV